MLTKSSSYEFGQIYWNPGFFHSFCSREFALCFWVTIHRELRLKVSSLHRCVTGGAQSQPFTRGGFLSAAALLMRALPHFVIQLPAPFTLAQAHFPFLQGIPQAVGRSHSELQLRKAIRELGLKKTSIITYLKMISFGLHYTIDLLVYFLLIQTFCGKKRDVIFRS